MNKGESICSLLQRFPDEESVLRYLFDLRAPSDNTCRICGSAKEWTYRKHWKCFATRCCSRTQTAFPRNGTLFEGTHLPLKTWLYAMLMMSNARAQAPTALLLRLLNITPKSLRRLLYSVRSYMGRIDAPLLLGGPDAIVHMDQAYLRGVARPGNRARRRALVVSLTDGHRYRSLVITPQIRARGSRLLRDMIAPGSMVIVRNRHLHQRILAKPSYAGAWVAKLGEPKLAEDDLFTSSTAAYWASCQRWLASSAKHVNIERAQGMLYEVAYKYSRRNRPETIFAELLSNLRRAGRP